MRPKMAKMRPKMAKMRPKMTKMKPKMGLLGGFGGCKTKYTHICE